MSSIWSSAAMMGAGTAANNGAGLLPGMWSAASFSSKHSALNGGNTASLTGKAAYTSATAQDSSSSSSSSTSDDNTSISANDFLTLLVTEMQNQDPTSDMDPNEYIDQLTQINSLEQLISINQNLQTALGETTTSSGSSTSDAAAEPVGAVAQQSAKAQALHPVQSSSAASQRSLAAKHTAPSAVASGNLSSPKVSEAAARVGHALSERSHGVSGPAVRDIPTRALP